MQKFSVSFDSRLSTFERRSVESFIEDSFVKNSYEHSKSEHSKVQNKFCKDGE